MKKKECLILGLCGLVATSVAYLAGNKEGNTTIASVHMTQHNKTFGDNIKVKASKDNNSAIAKSTKSPKSNVEHAQSSQQAKVTHENPIASKKYTHFGFFKTGLPHYKSVQIHGQTISGKQIARAAGILDDATLSKWDLAMIVYLANYQHTTLAKAKECYLK